MSACQEAYLAAEDVPSTSACSASASHAAQDYIALGVLMTHLTHGLPAEIATSSSKANQHHGMLPRGGA